MTNTVTAQTIESGARQLGIAGKPICVHASLRSFGWVQGGAPTVVEGLLGAGCTALVPTFSAFGVAPPDDPVMRPERNGTDPEWTFAYQPGKGRIYTPASQEVDIEELGVVPAAVLARSDRVRGNHPLNSFTAVGPQAHELIDGQAPLDVYQPLERLVELHGWVVLMGVGLTSLTLIHLAEQRAGRSPFRRWANDPQGQVMMVETGSCSHGFDKFEPVLSPLERRMTVGNSLWRVLDAGSALEAATRAILVAPSITHCGRPDCERCRDAILGGPIL